MIWEKVSWLPRSLHCEPRTTRLSGRDDGEERGETQEHSQEWLCHKRARLRRRPLQKLRCRLGVVIG
jgi:hypothetical protein